MKLNCFLSEFMSIKLHVCTHQSQHACLSYKTLDLYVQFRENTCTDCV